MKKIIFLFVCFSKLCFSQKTDSLPVKNKAVIDYVTQHGREISPTYQSAVCTELVIGVLTHFIELSKEDKTKIRIITNQNVYQLIEEKSDIPKGVYYALTNNGKGIPINNLNEVLAGDFVQFWYENWGHCGIVSSIDLSTKTMKLHSSFPSTDGYGIQEFYIPDFCFFVRLK